MTAAPEEEQEGDADVLSRVSEQLRENAAAAYIQRIEGPVAKLTGRAGIVGRDCNGRSWSQRKRSGGSARGAILDSCRGNRDDCGAIFRDGSFL